LSLYPELGYINISGKHILQLSLEASESFLETMKEAAEISMGTEISEEDITNIKHLCEQVVEIQVRQGFVDPFLKFWINNLNS